MSAARPTLLRRAAAEGLAAFVLVFAGCGAVVVDAAHDAALGSVGIAAAFGLAIMTMIYATGHLSGAHINPAVTLAFTLTRHFPSRDALAYVAAQLTGDRRHGRARLAWVYLAGPLAGASLGALAYQLIRGESPRAADATARRS
jgi:glycerol uptake facilitator-like aquaporin